MINEPKMKRVEMRFCAEARSHFTILNGDKGRGGSSSEATAP